MLRRLFVIVPVLLALLAVWALGLPVMHMTGAVSAALQATAPPTNTPRMTIPPTNTPRSSDTPTPTATETLLPSATWTSSPTAVPTDTPTPAPTEPAYLPTPTLYYPPDYEPRQAQPTAIPSPMPRFRSTDESGAPYEIMNVLLLGHDGALVPNDPNFHTDTMIIVSVNRNTNTISMISLPRDLFVYIPNWGMQRLNQAYWYGEAIEWTDGGWGMMRQTILYNFGIETHYYAMVDFQGFEAIVDTVGGVTIAVDCPILDDICVENCDDGIAGNETWEKKVIDVGVHHMNGEEALWYARSRENTIDFDRGRRQQQLLRAIWAASRDAGILTQIPSLWDQMTQVVQTNFPLAEAIPLIPLALSLQPNAIENHFFRKNVETLAWSPDGVTNVQIPHPDGGMQRLIENFLSPPTQNRLVLENARIDILNGTANDGWDIVATDRLIWEGFAPRAAGPAEQTDHPDTIIYDYTGSTKGSSLNDLARLLNVKPEQIFIEPDPNRTVDFRIILGANYNSCVDRQWIDPATMTD